MIEPPPASSAGSAAQDPAAIPGLYDRPVLVIDPGMHTGMIRRADADAAGHWTVTGSDDKTVRVWSLTDGKLARTIRLPAGPENVGNVYAVAMSPDGTLIAAGGWTRATDQQEQIYLFDRETGATVQRIEGMPNVVTHLAFSPDGNRLAAWLGSGHGLRIYSGERLSGLSSGTWELGAHIACFGVEANEEFVGEGDTDHLFRLACEGQSAVEGGEIGIVPAHELSDDEQDRADAAAPAAD